MDAVLPDLFLINLSLVSGLTLTKCIRQRSLHVGIVLIVPSSDTAVGRMLALDAGADNVLRKPYVSDELLAIIANLSRRLVFLKNRIAPADLEPTGL